MNTAFQHKYIFFLMMAVAGGTFIFFAPTFYFVHQNYEFFKKIAYDTAPHLVNHLEREVLWLAIFMALSLGFICAMTLIIGALVTRSLLTPLIRMERHMKELMHGNWHIPDYKPAKDDDFRDLAMTYDYFYRSLKANTEAELHLIEKLSIDNQNREAFAAWKNLITIKRSRLGIQNLPPEHFGITPLSRTGSDGISPTKNSNDPDAVSIESGHQRRAS